MENILNNALENLRNHPAAYTIMIALMAFSVIGITSFENEWLRFGVVIFCIVAVIYGLNLVVKNNIITPEPIEKTEETNHALANHLSKIEKACITVCEEKEDEHPLLVMIGGFMVQLSEEIAKDSIEIAPKYYISCFSSLRDLEGVFIYAIADLCADLENWKTGIRVSIQCGKV